MADDSKLSKAVHWISKILAYISPVVGPVNALLLELVRVAPDIRPTAAALSFMLPLCALGICWAAFGRGPRFKVQHPVVNVTLATVGLVGFFLLYRYLNLVVITDPFDPYVSALFQIAFAVAYALPFAFFAYGMFVLMVISDEK